MATYITEPPPQGAAQREGKHVPRDSRAVKSATPEAFARPPTDLGSNAVATFSPRFDYKKQRSDIDAPFNDCAPFKCFRGG